MIRSVLKDSCDLYNIKFNAYLPISSKAYKCKSEDGREYFIKTTDLYTQEKYKFLYNQGVNSILFPMKNCRGDFISRSVKNFYVTEYIPDFYMLNEIKAVNLATELNNLHSNTYFRRQLSVYASRHKMEEIFAYLQYKFSVLELFIRTVEARKFDEYSITFLKNYYIILDAKKIMGRLQRKVIADIREKKSVYFSFIHNNPKLEHLLASSGDQYLISIEKAKIGVPSLDMAKFYLENDDLDIDMKSIITTYFSKYDDSFYFDYFCFLVLLYYIKGIVIIDKDYVSSQSFLYATKSIKKFLTIFELSPENKTINK